MPCDQLLLDTETFAKVRHQSVIRGHTCRGQLIVLLVIFVAHDCLKIGQKRVSILLDQCIGSFGRHHSDCGIKRGPLIYVVPKCCPKLRERLGAVMSKWYGRMHNRVTLARPFEQVSECHALSVAQALPGVVESILSSNPQLEQSTDDGNDECTDQRPGFLTHAPDSRWPGTEGQVLHARSDAPIAEDLPNGADRRES